jgi:di/tricarboxylate transporter
MSSTKMSKGDMIKWIFQLGIPFAIALIPCGDVFTMPMKLFFVSTVFAILCFALETMNQTLVALALPAFWVFAGVAEPTVVFQPWTQYIPWVTLSGLLMANALESSGLLARIAYFCLVVTGGTYKGIVWGIMLCSALCTLFIGNCHIPMAALTYGICLALGTGKSRASAGIMLTAAFTCLVLNTTKMTAPLLMMGIGASVTGPLQFLGYFESFVKMAPVFLEVIILTWFVTVALKPEKEIQGKAYFEEKLAELGKITTDEIKSALIFVGFLIYIITKDMHGLSLEWGMVLIPLLLCAPGIGTKNAEKDIKRLNYGLILFVTACMGIGAVATSLGIGKLLVGVVLPILAGKSYYVFFFIVWMLLFLCNFLMTPLAMEAAFTVPLATIAVELGINPMALYYFILQGVDQIILPYEYALYLIYFAFGLIHTKDFMKVMGAKCIVNFIMCFALLLPWWGFLGFVLV